MKLRSLLIALTLGSILCLAPVITGVLPNPLLWAGFVRLSKEQGLHAIKTQNNTPQRAVSPTPELPKRTGNEVNNPMAMLLITKQSAPIVVKPGAPLTYTITVTNTGPASAHAVTIHDELPAGVYFRGESNLTVIKGDHPQLQLSDRQMTGTVDTLQATGHLIFIGRAIIDATANSVVLSNTAQVTATNNGNSNQRATAETILLIATTTPTPTTTALLPATVVTAAATIVTPAATAVPDRADLQIRKRAAPDPVVAGMIVTYTIVVSNMGPGRAHDLVIQDSLPQDLFFEGQSTLSVVHGAQPQLLLSRTQLTGTIAMLNAGGLITITAPVRTATVMVNQIRINQASVAASTLDQQPDNNSASTPVTLFPAPIMRYKNFLPAIYYPVN